MKSRWNEFLVWSSKLLVVFFLLFIVVGVLFFSVSCPIKEYNIRYCGLLLQLFGLLLAWYQIQGLKKKYGLKGNFYTFVSYLRNCPLLPRHESITGSIQIPISMSGEASCEVKYNYSATIEERLFRLESQVNVLCETIGNNHSELLSKCRAIEGMVFEEKDERMVSIDGVHKTLFESFVGGIFLTEFSMLYIFVGSIMSSVPEIIYGWFV